MVPDESFRKSIEEMAFKVRKKFVISREKLLNFDGLQSKSILKAYLVEGLYTKSILYLYQIYA